MLFRSKRRGLIDAALLARLSDANPRFGDRFRAVGLRLGVRPTSPVPAPPTAPALPAPASPPTWFLAHASPDKPLAEALFDALPPGSAFLDSRCLTPGDVWPLAIQRALAEASVVVVLVSARTAGGHYALDEIVAAVAAARKGARRVVPVWLDGAVDPTIAGA